MSEVMDKLYEVKDLLNNIEAEYERDPILLQDAIMEAEEAINRAIKILIGEE
jgi:hypothetical protein